MWKKENLRKNFLRVKQIADQNLGRAEKSEVLSEDLQSVEKRVELVKHVYQNITKKLASGLQSEGRDVEKRLKKLPEANLAHCLVESAGLLGQDTVMGSLFQLCGDCQNMCAKEMLQYEINLTVNILNPLQDVLDKDLPQLNKLRRHLNKVTLDMDSAKSRWQTAVRQTQVHGANIVSASNKADVIKEEYEEAQNRVEQAKDALATELFSFISKEADHSSKLLDLLEAQATYHRSALEAIERLLPKMRSTLDSNQCKPVYGTPLEEHLRVTDRDIALVVEACVCTLLEEGMEEEGLFRIAGMASKVKKLKAAFDANIVDLEEFVLDIHTVAGALKQYLRELPEPILTFKLCNEFLKAAQVPQEQRLQALHDTIEKLPRPNYNNFRYLIKFLSKLTEKSDVNKMTPSNIGIVIGPNLLWSEGESGPNMMTSGTVSSLVEIFVSNADWFFPGDTTFRLGEIEFGPGPLSSQNSSPSLSERPKSEHIVMERDTLSLNDFSQSKSESVPDIPSPLPQAQGMPQLQTQNNSKVASMSSPPPPPPAVVAGGDNNGQPSAVSQQHAVHLTAPLAESEQMSPKIPKRMTKKQAPPPPQRPFTVAVTASVGKSSNQSQTWPRQASAPTQSDPEENTHEEAKKQHSSPPGRPALPPEKPVLNQERAQSERHSGGPPERPKLPPPIAPQHQRSASTGAPPVIPPASPLTTDDKDDSPDMAS